MNKNPYGCGSFISLFLSFTALFNGWGSLIVIAFGVLAVVLFSKWQNREKRNRDLEIMKIAGLSEEDQEIEIGKKKNILLPSQKIEYKLVTNRGIQLLESLDIIINTKNIDTLTGRYRFIQTFYPKLISFSTIERYLTDMAVQLDHYKARYYDRDIYETQLRLLMFPNAGELNIFTSECVIRWFSRYALLQLHEILKLKTDKAKQKRIDNIISKGEEALEFLNEIGKPSPNDYEYILTKINEVRDNKEAALSELKGQTNELPV